MQAKKVQEIEVTFYALWSIYLEFKSKPVLFVKICYKIVEDQSLFLKKNIVVI